MKKFFITTTIPTTLYFFRGQCSQLKKYYDVTAVSSPEQLLEDFEVVEGVRTIKLPMKREIYLLHDLIALLRWILILLKERPFIIHGNTPKAGLLSMIAAWLTRVPVRLYFCHGLRYQGCYGVLRFITKLSEKISCCCATKVICVSKGIRQQLHEDGICNINKTVVVKNGSANGINMELYNPVVVDGTGVQKILGIEDYDWVIIFIGRRVVDKGIFELIGATRKLVEDGVPAKLLLVGDDDTTNNEKLKTIISKEAWIIDAGSQKDVRPYLKVSDVLVLPSYREGLGQVLLEANAMELPVVATNVVGCKNVVKHGFNGLLCEPKSVQSLYETLRTIHDDRELYDLIKSNTRQYISENFDMRSVTEAYIEFYKNFSEKAK